MTKPDRIPLFPLPVVLLPGTTLPLHIFEPRYKLMIRRCVSEKLEFGLIFATEKGLATVGCTAGVTEIIKEYPDGRLDILTDGRSVFRLMQLLDENEYYEGNVEYLVDASNDVDATQEEKLVQLYDQCHTLIYGQAWAATHQTEPESLAYRMAGRLPMDYEERQRLLEMRSEGARRKFVQEQLEQLLPLLMNRQRARQSASGNGHGPN
jgi:ATP-dependent Lon protease